MFTKYGRVFVLVPIVVVCINLTEEYSHFNPNRRPKLMGDILPFRAITPERQRVRNKIVMYHNFFRSKVQPRASNMLKMVCNPLVYYLIEPLYNVLDEIDLLYYPLTIEFYLKKWHRGAAMAAQKWADKCEFLVHDSVEGRHVAGYGACGQNIFIASSRVPWLFAIETWWLEKNAFKFGEKNNMTLIGHYTQLVWATTHEVGCGLSKCHRRMYDSKGKEIEGRKRVFYNYICNYCPIGNRPGRASFPYKLGNPCSSCKKECSKKLCLNSCDVANVWANCKELNKIYPSWLCRSNTPQGKQRARNCRATCTCANKIYDFY